MLNINIHIIVKHYNHIVLNIYIYTIICYIMYSVYYNSILNCYIIFISTYITYIYIILCTIRFMHAYTEKN